MASRLKDLTGQRFGRLMVIEREGTWHDLNGFGSTPTWRCKCDCGNETVVIGRNLKSGATRSCGCIKRGRKPRKADPYAIQLPAFPQKLRL